MKTTILLSFLLLLIQSVLAQTFVANYDESKVPVYKLPDPLIFNNGKAVKTAKDWAKRRTELYSVFEKEMYGKVSEGAVKSSFIEVSKDENACNGLAVRREIQLTLGREKKTVVLNLLLYLPKSVSDAPLFLGYNFSGNHTVSAETRIQIATSWVRNNSALGIANNQSTEAARGSDANSWLVSEIIKRGYGLATLYYGETITRTNTAFPHWFCGNFKKYNNKEETLPFDQHELLALIAPRPFYVSTAEEDRWGDPRGSFLACVAASPVYRLLGTKGFPGMTMPALEFPVVGTIGYHIRPGKHDVKPYDWLCFMNFADNYFKHLEGLNF
jgi:hypothetical protein